MKDCLIIGPAYAFNYDDAVKLPIEKVLNVGVWTVGWKSDKSDKGRLVCNWFTTLQVNRPEEKKLILTKTYNPDDYPRFDNAPGHHRE